MKKNKKFAYTAHYLLNSYYEHDLSEKDLNHLVEDNNYQPAYNDLDKAETLLRINGDIVQYRTLNGLYNGKETKYIYGISAKGIASFLNKKYVNDYLDRKKQKIDISNAKRIYKNYRRNQIIMWISFAISVCLGWLKLAESLRLWPYHK